MFCYGCPCEQDPNGPVAFAAKLSLVDK